MNSPWICHVASLCFFTGQVLVVLVLAKSPSASFSGRRGEAPSSGEAPEVVSLFLSASDFRIEIRWFCKLKHIIKKKTWWFWRRRVGKWNFINKNDDQDKVGLGGLRQPINSASKSMESKSGHSTNAMTFWILQFSYVELNYVCKIQWVASPWRFVQKKA